jgi:hypothetical protein
MVNLVQRSRHRLGSIPRGLLSISPALRGTSYAGLPNHKKHNSERVASIPDILLVKFNFVSPEKFAELVLERNL